MIKEIRYNYIPPCMELGEEYDAAEVGKEGVIRIEEHAAQFRGDAWYYDIVSQKKTIRSFRVFYVVSEAD